MPSSRSEAALSMAAWRAALSSALPSPTAPVRAIARGSSSLVVKKEAPGWPSAATVPATSRRAERRSFLIAASSQIPVTSLADQELDVPRALLPRPGNVKLILQCKNPVMLVAGPPLSGGGRERPIKAGCDEAFFLWSGGWRTGGG